MVDYECCDLVNGLGDDRVVAARDALLSDLAVANDQISLRVVALCAQHKFLDEAVEEILEFFRVVAAVDYEQVVVDGHLGA